MIEKIIKWYKKIFFEVGAKKLASEASVASENLIKKNKQAPVFTCPVRSSPYEVKGELRTLSFS
jgi:hypothetical protein